jgi:arylsulfatase A-like enzyme
VDRGVARVYDAVQQAGELRRTIFIYISDNGQFYGQHRQESGKVLPYDEALRLPLVVKAPRRYLGGVRPLTKIGRPVGNIDLAPTILDLAGGEPCPPQGACRTMDGRSLMPLLSRTGRWPPGRALLTEYRADESGKYATCAFSGIRTRTTIYIQHTRVVDPQTRDCVATDQRERYDLVHDPYELDNLCFGGGACPTDQRQIELQARLTDLEDCSGIAGRDPLPAGGHYCE